MLGCLALLFVFSSSSYGQKANKFKNKEIALIEQKLPNQPFRILTIDNEKDSVFLRKKARKVNLEKNTGQVNYFVKRLLVTVKDSSNMGVGIAAPQVGLKRQIIAVQRFDKPDNPFEIFINPQIVSCSDEKKIGKEGCLSIPNFSADIFRPIEITIEYLDLEGRKHLEQVSGFTSVIFQHEIDHLNGILFIDHLSQE